jgi:hypothetical protein
MYARSTLHTPFRRRRPPVAPKPAASQISSTLAPNISCCFATFAWAVSALIKQVNRDEKITSKCNLLIETII